MSTGLLHLLWILIWGREVSTLTKVPIKYSWTSVEFLYDNETQMAIDLAKGQYNPFNVVLIDADFYKNVYYVTTPDLTLSGTPATLSIITNEYDSNGSYLLKPFPNWSWHDRSTCDSIISVFRIKIDEAGRLWVIDCGIVSVFTNESRSICPPKLLAFDLNNNATLIEKYEFPKDQISADSLLLNLEVQIMNEISKETIVYIADPIADRMYVYHLARNESYMIEHAYFERDPTYENYNINSVSFTLADGLFSLAMDSSKDIMYFHSLSSGYECYVNGEILRKTTPLTDEEKQKYFKKFSYQKKKHTSSEVIAKYHNVTYLISAILEKNALYAWNTEKLFTKSNIRLKAMDATLDFVSGAKILKQSNSDEELLLTSSRLQNVIAYGKNEIGKKNFRILRGKVSDLLRGCCSSIINIFN